MKGHDCCRQCSASYPRLPTRVVDCTDPDHPRLVSTENRYGRYLTLSYVWGGDQVHKTTTRNISAYERSIDPALLPATICDAIRVTSSLGFQFLWIVSLCIIQDSDEDKRHELGRMHMIYRYAHLTIIASSAQKVSDGFLRDRPPPPQCQDVSEIRRGGEITLPFICPPCPPTSAGGPVDYTGAHRVGTIRVTSYPPSAPDPWPYSRNLGTISTRAWCMQEYLISPRSLIFTSRTLQFRCLTETRHIGDSLCDTFKEKRIPNALFLPESPAPAPGSSEWDNVHEAWLDVLNDYTSRTASDPWDKLIACAAVAEQFHRVLRSDYLAGLWRDTLLSDLLWFRRSGSAFMHRPGVYRAPSWSWAALEGEVMLDAIWSPAILDENVHYVFRELISCLPFSVCRVSQPRPTVRLYDQVVVRRR